MYRQHKRDIPNPWGFFLFFKTGPGESMKTMRVNQGEVPGRGMGGGPAGGSGGGGQAGSQQRGCGWGLQKAVHMMLAGEAEILRGCPEANLQ